MLRNIAKSICVFFNNACMNDQERYLSASVDLVDLEQRLRNVQSGAFNTFNNSLSFR